VCWMLTLALPPGATPPAGVRGLTIQPAPPGADAAGFPANWRRFNVSSGGCACALYAPVGTPADERVMRMREQIVAWADAYGTVGVRVSWAGRRHETQAGLGHGPDLTLRAQSFLRDGFPPHTTVWIRDKGGIHGRNMDR